MKNKEYLKGQQTDIVFAFDIGKDSGLVVDGCWGENLRNVELIGGTFENIKNELVSLKRYFERSPLPMELCEGKKQRIKLVFYQDKWGFRHVATALAEKRGILMGIMHELTEFYDIEVIKFNESAVYTHMRKSHPSAIKDKKEFAADFLKKTYKSQKQYSQDVADATLLYHYYHEIYGIGKISQKTK